MLHGRELASRSPTRLRVQQGRQAWRWIHTGKTSLVAAQSNVTGACKTIAFASNPFPMSGPPTDAFGTVYGSRELARVLVDASISDKFSCTDRACPATLRETTERARFGLL